MAKADLMTTLLSPAVGGSMQSQMEAKLASMNLKSFRTRVSYFRFPLRPHFQHQRHESPIARLRLFFLFPIIP
ncbi:hypothetical protein H4582DRAFT_1962700 [Lactarius indigo]|nr:hypothetical protein H4582DRAFT_1962700 [Lactarius indigo]